MVNQGLKLSETGTGKEVQEEFERLKEKHEKEIKEIRQEMEEAIKEKDEKRQEEFREYRVQINRLMREVTE